MQGRSGRPGGRPPAEARPATLGTWIAAARPATLALAIGPVALGTGAAALVMNVWYDHWVRALLCLAVAGLLQLGVNYANDYSDGVRGTDAHRVGPARLVGSGRAKPRHVLIAALVFFGLAAVAGLALVILTQHWWLLAVGVVAIAAAWFYTGGRRPYGYAGLGELAVFVFFGVVATAGTTFVQIGTVNIESWLGGVCAGLFAMAVLHVNNLRDREQDRLVGKRTLAVRIGDVGSRILFGVFVLAPFGILAFYVIFYDLAVYVYFALLAAVPAVLIVATARRAAEYVTALKVTLLTSLAFCVGLAAALAFWVDAGAGLVS
ncbi:1,4-dihydroxy-2-naphthoate polyprenyltransferase [Protaetiibacter intestinalis]|uniref:1,4-dihydroxy-2-naphthoate octaprenyltransferase n=1 Tax=Protaetiibacter intestinalis TaxID=2419774 RepID=A0A387BAS7_9MICO|nr:1,4-dihydroxy-2-naphthoate polyprenyltransferase [Protaetiibacter intestinalis]AYF99497.1 1,4-dihydroxy-2-naphthoate polyprenyltransferase [Protaetiibacter intestinalis]